MTLSASAASLEPVRVGMVGAGYWGPKLIRTLSALDSCRVAYICDVDLSTLDAAGRLCPGARVTTSIDELLGDVNVDAVVIATPADTHEALAVASLYAGKHVLVEKPMAATLTQAKRLQEAAARSNAIFMVGHLFLFDPFVARTIALVREGSIGEVRYIHIVRTSMGGTARLDTNVVADALIHDAYLLPALLQRQPKRVLAVGGAYLNPVIEDVAFVSMDFGNNILAHVYASWYAVDKVRRMAIIGSDSVLELDDLAPTKLWRHARGYSASPQLDLKGRRRWQWHDRGSEAIGATGPAPLEAECSHFITCIRTLQPPISDAASGVAAVAVVEACQRSLASGSSWVEL